MTLESNIKILVGGANGFTGRFICNELKNKNLTFSALIRHGNDTSWFDEKKINYIFVDLNNYQEVFKVFKGFNVFINSASLGFGAAPTLIKACVKRGIKRTIL